VPKPNYVAVIFLPSSYWSYSILSQSWVQISIDWGHIASLTPHHLLLIILLPWYLMKLNTVRFLASWRLGIPHIVTIRTVTLKRSLGSSSSTSLWNCSHARRSFTTTMTCWCDMPKASFTCWYVRASVRVGAVYASIHRVSSQSLFLSQPYERMMPFNITGFHLANVGPRYGIPGWNLTTGRW